MSFIRPVLIHRQLKDEHKRLVEKYFSSSDSPQIEYYQQLKLTSDFQPELGNAAKLKSLNKKLLIGILGDYLAFGYIDEFFEQITIKMKREVISPHFIDLFSRGLGLWLPQSKAVREDPRLIEIIASFGWLNIWQAEGFPDGCDFVESEPRHLKCE